MSVDSEPAEQDQREAKNDEQMTDDEEDEDEDEEMEQEEASESKHRKQWKEFLLDNPRVADCCLGFVLITGPPLDTKAAIAAAQARSRIKLHGVVLLVNASHRFALNKLSESDPLVCRSLLRLGLCARDAR